MIKVLNVIFKIYKFLFFNYFINYMIIYQHFLNLFLFGYHKFFLVIPITFFVNYFSHFLLFLLVQAFDGFSLFVHLNVYFYLFYKLTFYSQSVLVVLKEDLLYELFYQQRLLLQYLPNFLQQIILSFYHFHPIYFSFSLLIS